jgi:hypothetical protein
LSTIFYRVVKDRERVQEASIARLARQGRTSPEIDPILRRRAGRRRRAILAAVDVDPKMARIGSLLKDLPGEAGNGGEMYAWVDPGDADSMRE